MDKKSGSTYVYVGSYSDPTSEGIHIFSFDPGNGTLELVDRVVGIENPSFLVINSRKNVLYAVSETMAYQGRNGGSVAAFVIDESTGKLTWLNEQPTRGGAPCHLSVSHDGDFLFVVNYMGGNVCQFPIGENGAIEPMTDLVQHKGSGARPDRQEGPHPHSILLGSDSKFAFVSDLGLDAIYVYGVDRDARKLLPHGKVRVTPGAGPRHFVFHPHAPYAYGINELNSTITVFSYDSENGNLAGSQNIATLPESYQGNNDCADIHITPCGRFLYGSNRGHDSIATYLIDSATGMLTPTGHTSTDGRTPRNFAISPNGHFLLVANQGSDSIVTFAIDRESGGLHLTGQTIHVSRPTCIQILAN